MKKITLSLFIIILGLITMTNHAQVIIHVPSGYPTIQSAVDAAFSGDTVLVAPGTYQENILIQGNDKIITLASNFIFSGDTNDIINTIIDGSDPVDPNYGMVVLIKYQYAGPSSVVTGFTITGGRGYYNTYGGGIYASSATPVIRYNHIRDCSVSGIRPNGAGIYIGNSEGNPAFICLINHNVIMNCTVNAGSNTIEARGAGISLNSVKAIVQDNKISGNVITGNASTHSMGGGIYYYGDFPVYFQPQLLLMNNEITNNKVESWHAEGGGAALKGHSRYIIEGNTISHNEVITEGANGYAIGGGLSINDPGEGTAIAFNIIANNSSHEGPFSSDHKGGGIYLTQLSLLLPEACPLIERNRITGNTAFEGAGIACIRNGARIINNFISGNMAVMAGGAMYFDGPADTDLVSEVINNTITRNTANSQAGKAGSIYFTGKISYNQGYPVIPNEVFDHLLF